MLENKKTLIVLRKVPQADNYSPGISIKIYHVYLAENNYIHSVTPMISVWLAWETQG